MSHIFLLNYTHAFHNEKNPGMCLENVFWKKAAHIFKKQYNFNFIYVIIKPFCDKRCATTSKSSRYKLTSNALIKLRRHHLYLKKKY